MSRFHSNNGLYFERLPDGSVEVSYWLHGAANAGRADQMGVDVFVRGWTLSASEWASVMASVSARGETGPVHTEATLFHEKAGGREAPDTAPPMPRPKPGTGGCREAGHGQ